MMDVTVTESLVEKRIDSPLGALRLVANARALVGVYFASHVPAPRVRARAAVHHPILDAAARELGDYFAGARRRFDLPLEATGTPFRESVWRALAEIPYGHTRSYADIAARIGRPGAARAVGASNAHNPLSIVVPCHRVIGADASLTGYAGGEAAKRWLLAHEAQKRPAIAIDPGPGTIDMRTRSR